MEGEHRRLHTTLYKESVWITRDVQVQFLKPGVALVHVSWKSEGNKLRAKLVSSVTKLERGAGV